MDRLSIRKYASLCVLGTEAFYLLCLSYDSLLSSKIQEMHRASFELIIPGFHWISIGTVIWGGLYVGILSAIAGSYIAWMHNESLTR